MGSDYAEWDTNKDVALSLKFAKKRLGYKG